MKVISHVGVMLAGLSLVLAQEDGKSVADPVFWTEANCGSVGHVFDAVCCNDDHCKDFGSQKACQSDITCRWYNGECVENRDPANNVCCKTDTSANCIAIAAGECPSHFQVKPGCCDEKSMKYNGVLTTKPGLVCCNTPCEGANLNEGCDLPANCSGPTGRSLFGYGGGHSPDLGFSHAYLSHPPSHGSVIGYSGFEHSSAHLPVGPHEPKADKKVEEITVDDLMESLIQALTNDKGTLEQKDVFEFDQQKISNPYLGKVSLGGGKRGLNYPDPNYFLEQIYGNPYGLGIGPYGYGNGHHGSSGHGGYPSHGYGPSYGSAYDYGFGQSSHGFDPYSSHGGFSSHGSSYDTGYGYGSSHGSGHGSGYGSGYGGYETSHSSHGPSHGSYGNSYGPSYWPGYGSPYGGHGSSHGSSFGYPPSYGSGYWPSGGGHGSGYGPSYGLSHGPSGGHHGPSYGPSHGGHGRPGQSYGRHGSKSQYNAHSNDHGSASSGDSAYSS